MENISFEDVCLYVGRLYLDSQHQIKQLTARANASLAELRQQMAEIEQQRDDAVAALPILQSRIQPPERS